MENSFFKNLFPKFEKFFYIGVILSVFIISILFFFSKKSYDVVKKPLYIVFFEFNFNFMENSQIFSIKLLN